MDVLQKDVGRFDASVVASLGRSEGPWKPSVLDRLLNWGHVCQEPRCADLCSEQVYRYNENVYKRLALSEEEQKYFIIYENIFIKIYLWFVLERIFALNWGVKYLRKTVEMIIIDYWFLAQQGAQGITCTKHEVGSCCILPPSTSPGSTYRMWIDL